jgi:long-chain acyl-CoA synthetase
VNAVEWLLEIPRRNADRQFLIDVFSGEVLTFGALHQAGMTVATYLKHRGLKRGDRIAILLNNSADFVKLYFGCLYAGIVTVPINPVLAHKEIEFILQHSGARLLVVSPETIARTGQGSKGPDSMETLVLSAGTKEQDVPDGFQIMDLAALDYAERCQPLENVSPDDTMTIVYTSGTTASPKGVAHRIADLVENARLFCRTVGIGPQNRFYGILAMTYLGGYYNLLILPYVAESSVVLTKTFGADSAFNFWQPAIEHDVNTLWLVPSIMSILMSVDREDAGERFCREKVKCALVGTAPLTVGLRRDFEARYGVRLNENYGLSETLFIATESRFCPRRPGCVGRILPGVQATVLNDQGQAVPYNEEGEIYVASPFLMEGYVNPETGQPERIHQTDYFPTGDLGVLTPTGDLFITGRKKDLIIRGGINVSPAAIENVICEHPAVVDCAVIGIPHSISGEEIAAVVQLKSTFDFESIQPDLTELSKRHLGEIQRPTRFLEIEEFPRSSTGKIRKSKLRELLINKLGLYVPSASQTPPARRVNTPSANVNGRIRRHIPRPDAGIVQLLRGYSTSIISDCINRMGVMDACVYPLVRGLSFCGPALTVEEVEGGNLMSHAALELTQPGDVLVIDAKGVTTRACWGGLQTFMAKKRGVEGIVIFGTVRDFDEIVKCRIPVYALGTSPGGPLKGWSGNVNYAVNCGGLVISPGDIVVGDDDGIVVVPRNLLDRILPLCEHRAAMEREWFKSVEQGRATIDAVGLRAKLDAFEIEYE